MYIEKLARWKSEAYEVYVKSAPEKLIIYTSSSYLLSN